MFREGGDPLPRARRRAKLRGTGSGLFVWVLGLSTTHPDEHPETGETRTKGAW